MKKEVNLVAAINEVGVIGKGGKLLYHLKDDLKRFKELTLGGVVIMGRKTFESLPKSNPLVGRENIIISKTLKEGDIKGVKIFNDIEDAIENSTNEKIFIIGGEGIYREALDKNLITKMELTKIYDNSLGDTYFPFPHDYHMKWKVTKFGEQQGGEGNPKFRFITVEKD